MRVKNKKFGFALTTAFTAVFVFAVPNLAKAEGIMDTVGSVIGGLAGASAGKIVLWAINAVVDFIGLIVISIGASLLNYVFQFQSFLKIAVVQIGWTMSRDIANMGFILIMLAMAFGTILRIDSYGWKKLLPKLIMVALLINFSLMIGGVFIDMGNSLGLFFVSGGNGTNANIGDFIMTAMSAGKWAQLRNEVNSSVTSLLMASVVQLIFYLVMAFLLMSLAFIMIFRMINLWILLILAPLAWISYALPKFGSYWSKWWDTFLKWAFFPAVMGFFVFLGLLAGASFQGSEFGGPDVGGFWSVIFPETLFASVLQFIVVVVILFIGLSQAGKLSGVGSKTMMSGIGAAQKWGVGKMKKAGVGGLKLAGGAPKMVTDKLTDGAASRGLFKGREWLEKQRLIGRAVGGPGTAFAAKQKALKESAAKFSNLRPNDIEARLKQTALTPQALADRAGMIKALIDKGQFTIDTKPEFEKTWKNMLQTFQNSGGNLTDLIKRRPDLATNANVQQMITQDVNASPTTKKDWQEVIDAKDTVEKEVKIQEIFNKDIFKTSSDMAGIQREAFDSKGKLKGAELIEYNDLEDKKIVERQSREMESERTEEKIKENEEGMRAARTRGEDITPFVEEIRKLKESEAKSIDAYMKKMNELMTKQIQVTQKAGQDKSGQKMLLEFIAKQSSVEGTMTVGNLNSLSSKNKAAHLEVLKYLRYLAPGNRGVWKESIYKHVVAGEVSNTMVDQTSQPAPAP